MAGRSNPVVAFKPGLQSSGRPDRHLPDGILRCPGREPVAIELELSVKSLRRLNEIMRAHAADMDVAAVWYPTDRSCELLAPSSARRRITPTSRSGCSAHWLAKSETSGQTNNNEGERK